MTDAVLAKPTVSVVMPVRNAMPFLDQAIESILAQTFEDFELIVGDDASSDGSTDRLRDWAARDNRIRVMRRDTPSGFAGSSNWVAASARADLIARMDADDISHPERLARQVEAMVAHPRAVLVATVWEGIDEDGRVVRPPDLAGLFQPSAFSRPFAHGTVMVRKTAFHASGGYRSVCDSWEDTDLFIRLRRMGEVVILGEPLYRYRYSRASVRLHMSSDRINAQLALQIKCRSAFAKYASYESELDGEAGERLGASTPLPLRVLRKRAAWAVWAGQRSDLLGEFLRRRRGQRYSADGLSLMFLIWAYLSPGSLRWLQSCVARVQNRLVEHRLGAAEYVIWPVMEKRQSPDEVSAR